MAGLDARTAEMHPSILITLAAATGMTLAIALPNSEPAAGADSKDEAATSPITLQTRDCGSHSAGIWWTVTYPEYYICTKRRSGVCGGTAMEILSSRGSTAGIIVAQL